MEYIVKWKKTSYGQSTVIANSIEEARKSAEEGKDKNWEDFEDTYGEAVSAWEIEDIEEAK